MPSIARGSCKINPEAKHILLLVNSTTAGTFAPNWKETGMEFFCVLSVDGSLASYRIQGEAGGIFKAFLRQLNGQREDIPAEISLQKGADGWIAHPWHAEVVHGLIDAVEANGH